MELKTATDDQILKCFVSSHPEFSEDGDHRADVAREHGGVFITSFYDSRSWSVVDCVSPSGEEYIDFEEL